MDRENLENIIYQSIKEEDIVVCIKSSKNFEEGKLYKIIKFHPDGYFKNHVLVKPLVSETWPDGKKVIQGNNILISNVRKF